MNIVNALEASENHNPHGVSTRGLHATEHVQVVMVTLQSGEKLKLHITPVDVFFYVLEGVVTVEIGGDQQSVPVDTLVESPAGVPHRLLNESDTASRILVVKTPRPTTSTQVL